MIHAINAGFCGATNETTPLLIAFCENIASFYLTIAYGTLLGIRLGFADAW
jgi:hypothetical protein